MSNEFDSLLTLQETLQYLKISRSTIYKLMKNEDLKGIKIGRTWRFQKKDIEDFIKNKASAGGVDA